MLIQGLEVEIVDGAVFVVPFVDALDVEMRMGELESDYAQREEIGQHVGLLAGKRGKGFFFPKLFGCWVLAQWVIAERIPLDEEWIHEIDVIIDCDVVHSQRGERFLHLEQTVKAGADVAED